MSKKNMIISLTAALLAGALLTGCGQRADTGTGSQPATTQVQTQAQTEAATEKVTEIQIETQKQTETETQAPTEPPTERVTEAATEAAAQTADLPAQEEQEQETEFIASRTMYATDDINVRETPTTESSDNIISSYDQGEEVMVIAQTPHWYRVSKDGYTGYVHKDVLSETVVEPKTDEERSAAADAQASAAAASSSDGSSSGYDSSQVVNAYAESFSVEIAGDANLRASASENGDVIDVINAGTVVTAVGEDGDWYQVDYNGTIGYVNKNLVNS